MFRLGRSAPTLQKLAPTGIEAINGRKKMRAAGGALANKLPTNKTQLSRNANPILQLQRNRPLPKPLPQIQNSNHLSLRISYHVQGQSRPQRFFLHQAFHQKHRRRQKVNLRKGLPA